MTLGTTPLVDHDVVARAAARAAAQAGVRIRSLVAVADMAGVEELFASIWEPRAPSGGQPDAAATAVPVNREVMRALAHTGGYVAGAFDGDVLVGAAVGFFSAPADRILHSHVAGIAPGASGRGIGYALKLHQHAWAMDRDLEAVTWTFDPLVRRNAHFNVAKLGALPVDYLVSFYGEMLDGVNAGQDSDRLLVSWPVGRLPAGRLDGVPDGATVVLDTGANGGPVGAGAGPSATGPVLIRTPADVEALRLTTPGLAAAWRGALRDALEPLLAAGDRVVAFTRDGYYVVERGATVSIALKGLELVRVRMPLTAPFRTSFGVETERDVLLVRAETAEAEGWGECVAMGAPLYSPEYVDGAAEVIERFLAPRLFAAEKLSAGTVAELLAPVRGHRMAKAAVETALLDAELRAIDRSLAEHLGGVRERCAAGVSVGIMDRIDTLLTAVNGYVDQGYVRVKLKIEPGWDVEPVREVRNAFGDLPLQVDANAAYTLGDAAHLRRLDAFDLLLIEQPLAEEDLRQHAQLARLLDTPICLDESITSAVAAADALALGACRIVNIKPGRVGGYLESRRIHDLCRAHGVPVWCGGMLESGLGRAANVALASLPGFTLPGDISASDRYFETDLTPPFTLVEGTVEVPSGPGIGVRPVPELLTAWTTWRRWIGRD